MLPNSIGKTLRLIWNLSLDKFRQQDKRFLPAEIARLGWNDSGTPSCTMFSSVPHETFLSVIVVCISPAKFGSSNLSV